MNYRPVYDIATASNPMWTSVSTGGVVTLVTAVLVFVVPAFRRMVSRKTGDNQLTRRVQAFFAFLLLCAGLGIWSSFSRTSATQSALAKSPCQIIEGHVTDFSPMPSGGHAMETFSVSGVPFAFSDFVINGGFNNTVSHGGPIREGKWVRICYVHNGALDENVILRLEIGY